MPPFYGDVRMGLIAWLLVWFVLHILVLGRRIQIHVSIHSPSLLPWLQRPHKATHAEIARYHSDDYVSFLASIRPDNQQDHQKEMLRCECFQVQWNLSIEDTTGTPPCH